MTLRKQPTPEELDAIWREEIAQDNDMAICIMARMERASREAGEALAELRDLARMKFFEK